MTWISVKDRLPEDADEYLIVVDGKTYFGFYSTAFDEWWRDNQVVYGVTHWQPLPAPPEDTS